MITQIQEFPVTPGQSSVTAPVGAEFLSAQLREGTLTLTARVDPAAPRTALPIAIIGTGEAIEANRLDGLQFLGTVIAQDDAPEWHVFAAKPHA